MSSASLLVRDITSTPAIPLPIKLGDANLDGFPDLLFIIAPPGASHDRVAKLVFSVPCAKGVVGCASNGSGRRGWSVVTKGTEVLDEMKDARGVTFLDMDEDVSGLYGSKTSQCKVISLNPGHAGYLGSKNWD